VLNKKQKQKDHDRLDETLDPIPKLARTSIRGRRRRLKKPPQLLAAPPHCSSGNSIADIPTIKSSGSPVNQPSSQPFVLEI
jgi:hypothetical protein